MTTLDTQWYAIDLGAVNNRWLSLCHIAAPWMKVDNVAADIAHAPQVSNAPHYHPTRERLEHRLELCLRHRKSCDTWGRLGREHVTVESVSWNLLEVSQASQFLISALDARYGLPKGR